MITFLAVMIVLAVFVFFLAAAWLSSDNDTHPASAWMFGSFMVGMVMFIIFAFAGDLFAPVGTRHRQEATAQLVSQGWRVVAYDKTMTLLTSADSKTQVRVQQTPDGGVEQVLNPKELVIVGEMPQASPEAEKK